jgi:hypothetical protein
MVPTVKFTPGMGPTEGYDVSFATTSGLNGTVFVSKMQLGDIEAIAHAIAQEVSKLDAINKLNG